MLRALLPPLLSATAAASPDEFALLPRLLKWQQNGLLQLQLHTTRDHRPIQGTLQQQGVDAGLHPPSVQQGRITAAHLQAALKTLQENEPS